ncbi:MAG: site-specific integrase [Roseburia sp.]|nr:site-specific integrase [Roseburia sp.]
MFLGLRKAEICGLSWDDIDLDNKTLSVNRNSIYFRKFGIVTKGTKTRTSKRTIHLPEQLVIILSEYKVWYDNQKTIHGDLWADTDKLFLQDNGNTINPCTINSWLRKFNLEHGFKNIPPHSLRHTSITMQLKAGVPIKAVSARAGHSSERITLDIYTHMLQSQDEQAAEIYDKYLMGG